jgi:hypothetical protein
MNQSGDTNTMQMQVARTVTASLFPLWRPERLGNMGTQPPFASDFKSLTRDALRKSRCRVTSGGLTTSGLPAAATFVSMAPVNL